ncbi:MAG: RhuM family protein [Corynebacterium sp.]|uniref:RhuM family protein n=1 Tax=Corynebacterium sp. TaxID=1720 RepID=UPI0026E10ABB|nr:RhuM family protein [Corynebacterium sp.]MDO5670031.1 RhuM family protein [Corynebacterium sp.]
MTSLAGDIVLYDSEDGAPALSVRLTDDTVWLTQAQLAELFQTSRTNIVEHIGNVYADGELEKSATCRDFRQVRIEGKRQVNRAIPHYNLDVIISVGYRIKSQVATRFRIWATDRLREYLVQGYSINRQRLDELGAVVRILGRADDEAVAGIADVIGHYLPGLHLLRDFDEGEIVSAPAALPEWTLTVDEARSVIAEVAASFPMDSLFGNEPGEGLEGITRGIYQTFGGDDLYPTVEEKAANLLYLVVKNHPLSDGNKRSAAALFVTFLARNGALFDEHGRPRLSNNALATITLMTAMSEPAEKDLIVALLIRMLTDD